MRSDQNCSKKFIKMIDTADSHYGVILETMKKKSSDVMFVEHNRAQAHESFEKLPKKTISGSS